MGFIPLAAVGGSTPARAGHGNLDETPSIGQLRARRFRRYLDRCGGVGVGLRTELQQAAEPVFKLLPLKEQPIVPSETLSRKRMRHSAIACGYFKQAGVQRSFRKLGNLGQSVAGLFPYRQAAGRYPGGEHLLMFSDVYFNQKRTVALVHVNW